VSGLFGPGLAAQENFSGNSISFVDCRTLYIIISINALKKRTTRVLYGTVQNLFFFSNAYHCTIFFKGSVPQIFLLPVFIKKVKPKFQSTMFLKAEDNKKSSSMDGNLMNPPKFDRECRCY
jgi:hypothetical protein